MFSPTARLRLADGVRLRPIEEWQDQCFVYAPDRGLHLLNLTGWFLLQGCDGRTVEGLRDEFSSLVRTQRWANRAQELAEGYLLELWRCGLITLDGAAYGAAL